MIEGSKFGYYLMPILKVWLFMFFLILCTIPFGLIAQLNFLPSITYPLAVDILEQISLIFVVLGALLMMFRIFPDLDFYEVYIRKERSVLHFFKGAAVGGLIMIVCALVLYLNGNVHFEVAVISWQTVALYLLYFFLISVFEEFLFRSYPLLALAERYPLWFAILVNGILFALAHFTNPGLTLLGVLNITLAGMLFAIYTLQKQSIAWAVGIHFAWNFTQAIVLGYNVSGNAINGLAKAVPKGAEYLSGGSFGIEGSIFCTLILLILIFWLVYKNGLRYFIVSEEFEAKE